MKTITLKHPVKHPDGSEIASVELPDRITAKQLRVTDKAEGPIGKVMELVGEMCKVPKSVVEQIDAEDFVLIADEVRRFL